MEIWRSALGYEGRYEVSDHGNMRSLIPWRNLPIPRPLKVTNHLRSYSSVGPLYSEMGKRHENVHLLVLEAFVGPRPSPDYVARHLNDDRTDNRLSNLVWGTKSENVRDSVRNGRHPQSRKTHCARGHLFDEANTRVYLDKTGAVCRICRTCARANVAKYNARKLARAPIT